MANLESMFIEVSGDASKASSSIDKLVVSLNKLSGIVSSTTPALKELATALQQIQQISANAKINWKNMMPTANKQTISGMKQTASALRSSTTAFNKYASSFQNAQATISGNQNPMATALGQTATNAAGSTGNKYAAQMQQATAQTTAGTQAQQGYANATQLSAQAQQQLAQAQNQAGKATKNASNATQSATNSMKQHASTASKIAHHFGKLGGSIKGAFSQIFRMAKSMLIRNALRSMIKGAREGLENYYNYSKAVGDGFSQTMDQMAGTAAQMKNQLGAALASAIMTLTPALNQLAEAAQWALEMITALFAALGGRDTYKRATKQTASFAQETKKAGGAVKDLLADFDELNVITSGGGGGGGGGATPDYETLFEDVPVPDWIKTLADWLPWIGGLIAAAKAWGGLKWLLNLFDKMKKTKFPTVPNVNTPDWSSFLTQLEQVIAKIGEINTGVTNINTSLFTLKATTKAWETELWACLLPIAAIAAALLMISSPKLTVKVNREEFDSLKEAVDDFTEDLKDNPRVMKINVKVNLHEFTRALTLITGWTAQTPTKTIKVDVDLTDFNAKKQEILDWINQPISKSIGVGIGYDPEQLFKFFKDSLAIAQWVDNIGTKHIRVVFDSVALSAFKATASAIDSWANQTLTKVINVVLKTTTSGGGASGASGLLNQNLSKQGSTKDNSKNGNLFASTDLGEFGSSSASVNKNYYADIVKKNIEDAQNATKSLSQIGAVAAEYLTAVPKAFKEDPLGTLLDGIGLVADGGMVNRGDLFIANENGAELIGSINGKTSVANQEQIIEGISRGVENANMEQNALLRQQNELLRNILAKEATVRFGASAALGRTAKQSIDMYNSMVGG